MNVRTIKTHKITTGDNDILAVLDKYLPTLKKNSVVAITSKIVSLCEGRVASKDRTKAELIEEEAERFIPPGDGVYKYNITIARNSLISAAGIDESNVEDAYVLWPKDPQHSANVIRAHLHKKCGRVGVIITDSHTVPLRRGTSGMSLAHSGFSALNNYVGTPDIFGRHLRVTKANVAEGLAATAVLMMGEGKEQTPIAIIEDVPFITFSDSDPTAVELEELSITPEEDVFGPLLLSAKWQKGKGK